MDYGKIQALADQLRGDGIKFAVDDFVRIPETGDRYIGISPSDEIEGRWTVVRYDDDEDWEQLVDYNATYETVKSLV